MLYKGILQKKDITFECELACFIVQLSWIHCFTGKESIVQPSKKILPSLILQMHLTKLLKSYCLYCNNIRNYATDTEQPEEKIWHDRCVDSKNRNYIVHHSSLVIYVSIGLWLLFVVILYTSSYSYTWCPF